MQSQVKNLSRIKEPRIDSPWKRQILLSQVSLLISSSRHRNCDVFFVGIFLKSFWFWAIWRELRKLDDYVLRGEREHFKYAHPTG